MPEDKKTKNEAKRLKIKDRFKEFFDEKALTKLTIDLDTTPEKQQEVLRNYAKKIVEEILDYVKCPENTGALLNLNYPRDLVEFEDQIWNLMGKIEDLDKETFDLYGALVSRIRKDVIRLIKEEIEKRGLDKKIGIMGNFYGRGGMGEIHSCRIGQSNVAMKKLFYADEELENPPEYYTYPELIKATKNNENLVAYFGSINLDHENPNEPQGRIDFFEELRGAKSLNEYLKEIAAKEAGSAMVSLNDFFENFFIPALNGVKALHDKNLVHRDLKPDNIFLIQRGKKFDIKVGDYDLVVRSGHKPKGKIIQGSYSYLSPEQCECEEITTRSDVYALGMILYYLFGGKRPENAMAAITKAISRYNFDKNIDAPPFIKRMIRSCTKRIPEERPSIEELLREFEHYSAEEGEDWIFRPYSFKFTKKTMRESYKDLAA